MDRRYVQYTDCRDSKLFIIVIAIVDFYHAMITIDTITSPTVQGKVCLHASLEDMVQWQC